MTYIDDETIKEQYINKNKSIQDIASMAGVSYTAIYHRVVRLDILKKEVPTKREPFDFEKQKNTTNASTRAFLKRLELKEEEIGVPVKDFIEEKYWDESMSPKEIGILLDMPVSTIVTWMRQLGIKMRSRSESLKLYISKHPDAHQHTTNTFKDEAIREKASEANRKLRQGKTVEEIYGVDEGKRLRKLYSEQRKGELNPIYGTKRPQHVCDALSKAHKGKKQSPEHRLLRLRKSFAKMRMAPNKLELRILNIIEESSLPFKFVGDGSMIIHGFAPDFISTDGSMKIIEVFGDYWHGEKNPDLTYVRTEDGRKKVFADLGYDMLVLWESKINSSTDEQLHNEITSFMN